MRRRQLLQGAILGGLALSVGPRIMIPVPETEAVPTGTPREVWRAAQLAEAWRSAAQQGTPLLLIVVPEDATERWQRGRIWGEVITHGPEDLITGLCTVALATATQAEVAALLPDFAPLSPEPLAILVDPTAIPATWSVLQLSLPAPAVGARAYDPEVRATEDADISTRIAALSAGLLSLIQPSPQRLARVQHPEALAARRKDPIPGSRWGYAAGCGTDYETADPLEPEASLMAMVDCGMGHVNARSSRFLDFLTEAPTPEP